MPTIRRISVAPKPIRPIRIVPNPDVIRIPRERTGHDPDSPSEVETSTPSGD